MWNKSTRGDIQDMFGELQQLDAREDGLSLRTRSGPGGKKPPGYEKRPDVLKRKAEWARDARVHVRPHVQAKKAEWEEGNREMRTDRRREQRRALRVCQRAADLDVVDCATQ
jgi:hypothetical protein